MYCVSQAEGTDVTRSYSLPMYVYLVRSVASENATDAGERYVDSVCWPTELGTEWWPTAVIVRPRHDTVTLCESILCST